MENPFYIDISDNRLITTVELFLGLRSSQRHYDPKYDPKTNSGVQISMQPCKRCRNVSEEYKLVERSQSVKLLSAVTSSPSQSGLIFF